MSSRGGKKKSTKTSRSAKAGVIFPVGRMLRYIKKGHPKYRIGVGAPVYMAAVLEYLTGKCARGQLWMPLAQVAIVLTAFQGLTDRTHFISLVLKHFKPTEKLQE